ncbi:L-ascorbate metabolism protein UlaG (beta-lactamase superfamily) [Thermosporothrix hazakensis]|jgi:L-ascorbate metabolism protein UlaG (beta-lactamase superfamily)|uniref:UPF0173 metal-dependent hydrolase EI42_00279 n=1 Tax=Thermosporothrix hazakensis TaxID=644383 RepID=A0A326UPH6_THEHA|nr:metal-dependent hydrolase [Thermosporothrix hazakensis]PZW36109.1 L-ascorbate metabolism protein UlaG (beta-lactamase superfamily) [Thermosporothrix hazakensis]GCE46760.1 metal-dependent hydrolase [Thermosporothrix hazakensis]
MTLQLQGAKITWLGHATFKITTPSNKVILIDPWLEHNPACPAEARKFEHLDLILATHGHSDHIGDAVATAKQYKPQVIAIVELANWLSSKGVENTIGINKGGSVVIDNITISMTHALHTSGLEDGSYGGEPAGYVIELENGLKIYHAGDTMPFTDMQIIRELYAPDIAMLPIGDFFTMGPRGAALATRLLGVKHVIPMHYATFPVLRGTPAELREELGKLGLDQVEVIEMKPGQTIS